MTTENQDDDQIFEKISGENEDVQIDDAPYKITTYGADMTLEVLTNKLKEHEIVIPPFQRKYVWSPSKASRLIESCLLQLPVPQVFLYREEKTENLLVVDGQQRLKSVLYFFQGAFENGESFFLTGVRPEWEGKTFVTLSEPERRRLKNYVLRATIFEQTDPRDNSSVFHIFERLNTGGMTLKPQEIRNCIIRGTINGFLDDLNKNEDWRLLFGQPEPDPRQRDAEMVLRFLSLLENKAEYHKPMHEFMNVYMRKIKDIDVARQQSLKSIFEHTMKAINTQVGVRAFRPKGPINVAVFDSIAVAVALCGPDKVIGLSEKIKQLLANPSYQDAVSKSTTDEERVDRRIKIAVDVFSK